MAKDVLKQEIIAVNLGMEEVKYSGGRDYKPGKGAVSCYKIRCTSVVVIKGVLDLIYLLKEGYYYTVLLLHTVKAVLALLYI